MPATKKGEVETSPSKEALDQIEAELEILLQDDYIEEQKRKVDYSWLYEPARKYKDKKRLIS
jgi:hypothetical protein